MKNLGKYRIEKELGQGAMGIVYLAFDPVIERRVAIKTMNKESFKDEEQRQRFVREAKSAGGLQHPNIVTIFDMGIDDNTPYIVMEFIEGKDLDELIRNSDAISFKDKISIMAQLCDALGFAHDNSIVHRDIKPANIRVLPNGKVKVMDFGIAKKQDSDLTRTGLVVGTISYMSPEQVQGKKISSKSDQFSAGVVFYQLLTGKKPFEGENITSVIFKIVSSQPESLNFENIPEHIVAIIKKMLAHDEDQRFESCHKVAELLRMDFTGTSEQKNSDIEPETEILNRPVGSSVGPPPLPPSPPLPPAPQLQVPQSKRITQPMTESQSYQNNPSKSGFKLFLLVIIIVSILGVSAYFGYKFIYSKNDQKVSKHELQYTESTSVKNFDSSENSTNDNSKKENGDEIEISDEKSIDLEPVELTEKQEDVPQNNNEKNIQEDLNKNAGTEIKNVENSVPVQTETIQKPKPDMSPKVNSEKVQKPKPDMSSKENTESVSQPENSVEKKEILSGFREDFQNLRRRALRMPQQNKKNMSKIKINTGKNYFSNRKYLDAAKQFTEAIILDSSNVHGYSNLVICLEKLNAYEEAQNVLKRAAHNGVTVSEMSENIFFKESYNKIINR